jgi:hypothetical protein
MNRDPDERLAVGSLFLLHALADIAVGVFRFQDVDWAATDVMSAALSRSQICLLAIWLVLGRTRFSWRLCGLIAGSSFTFSVFTRTALAPQHALGSSAMWLDEEWIHYFGPSEPGDYLVKSPILLCGIVVPLIVWRWRGRRLNEEFHSSRSESTKLFRFGLADTALWAFTLCVVLVCVFQTAPYPEWFSQLFEHWRQTYRMPDAAAKYSVLSSLLYLVLALVSLWVVHSHKRGYVRLFVLAALVVIPSFWLPSTEIVMGGVVAAIIVGSLFLGKLYGALLLAASGPRRV